MDTLTTLAASGLRSRMEALDLLANNLANSATAGFKADRELNRLYVAPEAEEDTFGRRATAPVLERHWTDFSQGLLTETGNPLEAAIEGRGFFAVRGPADTTLYTRDGNFRLGPAGELVTRDGFALRSREGQPIRLDRTRPFEILPDGTVRQGEAAIARLEIADFEKPAMLAKRAGNYFHMADPRVLPAAASEARVHQGRIEASNIPTAETAVRLVSVMRQFEMLQRALALGGEMNRRLVEDVARAS